MERNQLYTYAIILIVIVVLLIVCVADYFSIQSTGQQLDQMKRQQQELVKIITSGHMGDMDAAKRAWAMANQDEYISLQNQGISVEPDGLATSEYTAAMDLRNPSQSTLEVLPSDVAPGEVVVYLGKYYDANMTRVSGWVASYVVDSTDHKVTGLTSALVQSIAYDYYSKNVAPTAYQLLGVSADTVMDTSQHHIDCSYIGNDTWMDTAEYRYRLKNTDVVSYMLVKVYVNATTQQAESVDVSKPYFNSLTGNELF